jgi:hypothetical protein
MPRTIDNVEQQLLPRASGFGALLTTPPRAAFRDVVLLHSGRGAW